MEHLKQQVEQWVMAPFLLAPNDPFEGKAFHPMEWFVRNMKHGRAEGVEEQMEPQMCTNNSIEVMHSENFAYMEGFVVVHIPLVHAWNRRPDGSWVDYTLWDASDHDYFGVKIPRELVYMACTHEFWPHCTGVLQTMLRFSDKELAAAWEVLCAETQN